MVANVWTGIGHRVILAALGCGLLDVRFAWAERVAPCNGRELARRATVSQACRGVGGGRSGHDCQICKGRRNRVFDVRAATMGSASYTHSQPGQSETVGKPATALCHCCARGEQVQADGGWLCFVRMSNDQGQLDGLRSLQTEVYHSNQISEGVG